MKLTQRDAMVSFSALMIGVRNGRDGRVVEGAPLLREYGVKSSIEGSNPSLSATSKTTSFTGGFRSGGRNIWDLNPRSNIKWVQQIRWERI